MPRNLSTSGLGHKRALEAEEEGECVQSSFAKYVDSSSLPLRFVSGRDHSFRGCFASLRSAVKSEMRGFLAALGMTTKLLCCCVAVLRC